ncbi:MAG: formylglycine-generating enzyme family protein [Cyanobacteria bacterium P01_F01_bin.56]
MAQFGNRQQSTIPMVTPDHTRKSAHIVRWWDGECRIQLTCDGQSWQGSGYDALASLIDVRQHFEPDGYRLLCYGASLNSSPSGMSRDSDMVHQLGWGEPPKRAQPKSTHDIFATGPDVIPATYQEQQAFKEQWHASVKLDRRGIAYDVSAYPVVAVDCQGNLARYYSGQNMTITEMIGEMPLEVVLIPKGNFLMGVADEPGSGASDRYYRDEPQHKVRIRKQFWLGKYPVTQAQWRAVAALPQVQCDMRLEPSQYRPHVDIHLDNHPINHIFWAEAIEFCARLSLYTGRAYRLPTEAEWEYACKAGTTTPWHFGEYIGVQRSQLSDELKSLITSPSGGMGMTYLLNFDGLMKGTTPVGRYPANPWGLYGMHGNVYEWCLDDWHWDYSAKPETIKQNGNQPWHHHEGLSNPQNPSDKKRFRPVRGGTWGSSVPECLSTFRAPGFTDNADMICGLRVVCEAV